MVNPAEKLENPDMEDDSLESSTDKSKQTGENLPKPPENAADAEIIDLQKRREEILKARNKPTQTTAESQRDRTAETMERSAEEEEIAMEKEALAEQLEKGGLKLTEEEIQGLYDAIPDLVNGISPEFSEYMQGMMPRLEKTMDAVENFKKEGNEYKGVETLADFLGEEMDGIEKIKDEDTRNQLISFMKSTIDIEKVVADMKKQTTVDGATELAKVVPVFGPGIDLAEAARGRTVAGEKLSGGKRVVRASVGTACMVLDVAGIATGGTTTAARVGISAAKAGKSAAEVAKAASGAYKAAKAAEKIGKTATLAARGARIGKTVTRFAALSRKTTKLNRISKTIFKVGKLIQKYPKLAGVISKTIKLRSKYKGVRNNIKLAGKVVKVARVARATAKIAGVGQPVMPSETTTTSKSAPEEDLPAAA